MAASDCNNKTVVVAQFPDHMSQLGVTTLRSSWKMAGQPLMQLLSMTACLFTAAALAEAGCDEVLAVTAAVSVSIRGVRVLVDNELMIRQGKSCVLSRAPQSNEPNASCSFLLSIALAVFCKIAAMGVNATTDACPQPLTFDLIKPELPCCDRRSHQVTNSIPRTCKQKSTSGYMLGSVSQSASVLLSFVCAGRGSMVCLASLSAIQSQESWIAPPTPPPPPPATIPMRVLWMRQQSKLELQGIGPTGAGTAVAAVGFHRDCQHPVFLGIFAVQMIDVFLAVQRTEVRSDTYKCMGA